MTTNKFLIIVKATGENFIRHLYPAIQNYDVAHTRDQALIYLSRKRYDYLLLEWGNDLTALVVADQRVSDYKAMRRFRVIVRIHDHEVTKHPARAEHINYSNVDYVWFINKMIEDIFKASINDRVKTFYLPNAVDSTGVVPNVKSFKIAGLVSIYLKPRKCIERFIEIAREKPDWYFTIRSHIPKDRSERFYDYYRKLLKLSEGLTNLVFEHRDADALILNNYMNDDLFEWYKNISVIMSTSVHEGFHYAVAQGMLTGCKPIVFSWNQARAFYNDHVVDSVPEAVQVLDDWEPDTDPEIMAKHIKTNYSPENIYKHLIDILGYLKSYSL